MDFSNFYIQHQNGDKEQLKQIKHGVRKDMLSSKFSKIFEAYDNNSNGTLEAYELSKIFNGLTQIAQISQSQKDEDNRVLDFNENEVAKSIFLNIGKIENVDFMGFVKSVSDASQGVEKSTVNTTPDGGKEITTIYKNGAVETISYYPDGGYKYKIFDCKNDETKRCFTLNNEKYSEEAFELKIRKAYNNSVKLRSPDPEIAKIGSTEQDYQNFKNEFIKNNNVQSFLSTETVEIRHEVDLSERAKKDVEARNFVLQHYIDTHKATKEILSTMGYLDDIGAAINAGAGELWNKVKNLFNDNPVEYQNFYELCQKFESSYNHSLVENENLKKLQDHPEEYFNKSNFKMENAQQFKETTQQYYNAKALKMRLDLLDGAISGLTNSINLGNEFKKGSGRAALHYDTPPIADAREYLLEYFNGDEECVNLLLCGNDEKLSKEEALERVKTLDEKSQKYLLYPDEKDENVFHLITLGLSLIPNKEQALETIKALKENTDKLYNNTLNGKTYNEIENKYKAEYKDIFKTDYIPEDLSEKALAAKETAGMVKMGAITIVSILVSKSPIMGRISAALAGNAEATGLAANYTRALVAKFGKTAVEEGIRLAMTCGTITESIGLTLLNQVTSERGYDGKEFLETTTSEAKYLFVGAYLGAPLAQKVSGALGKLVNLEQLIKNSPKATNVAAHTLKITGAELLQGLGALTTEGAIFTGLEVATEGNNLKDAISGQGETLSKLKLMNHIIAYMLGAKTHTLYKSNMSAAEKAKLQAANAQIEKAIEKSGIKNLEITRKETPEGTKITTSVFGSNRKSEFKNETELATALAEEVAKNFEGDIESLSEIQSFKNEVLPPTEQEIQASKAAQETTILTLQKLNKQFIDNGKSGKIYTTIDGRQLVEIETTPNSHKYDYYEFDKDKKLVTAMDNFSKEFFQDNFPDFLHIVPKDFGAKAKVENYKPFREEFNKNKSKSENPQNVRGEDLLDELSIKPEVSKIISSFYDNFMKNELDKNDFIRFFEKYNLNDDFELLKYEQIQNTLIDAYFDNKFYSFDKINKDSKIIKLEQKNKSGKTKNIIMYEIQADGTVKEIGNYNKSATAQISTIYGTNGDVEVRGTYDNSHEQVPMQEASFMEEEFYDNAGKLTSRITSKPSDIAPNATVTKQEFFDANGNITNVRNLSSVKQEGNNLIIERNFTSPSGIKTTQKIVKNANGYTSVIDVNGVKTQLEFKKLNENTSLTTVNNETFKTEITNSGIKITKTSKNGTVEEKSLDWQKLDPVLKDLYKQLPGNCLFKLAQEDIKVEYHENDSVCEFSEQDRVISINKTYASDPFNFCHELGHALNRGYAKYNTNPLHKDINLINIYNEEFEEFAKTATIGEQQIIGYFSKDIDAAKDPNSKFSKNFDPYSHINEIVAETHALSTGLLHDQPRELERARILQEKFPKTCAYIMQQLKL